MSHLRPVPDTPPRAVLYLRQSTTRDDSISIEMQESAGREYCARMGYTVVDVKSDPGFSGRKWDNRPAVQQVMAMVDAGDADVIVLWKWSRLSRSRLHWALASDRVAAAGGRIESATEPIDTSTASGRFARGVMTEYAAFQSEQIGETWEEVRQRRLRLGLPASGRLPWGWEWVGDGTIRPVDECVPTIREMYRRYLAGHGSSAISRWLNANQIPAPNGGLWNRVRPFTVMDSPIHAGFVPYRGAEYAGSHEGIIDAGTWDEYKTMRRQRREGRQKPRQSKYLLSGIVRCGCGLRMTGKGAVTGGIWYSGYLCTSMAPEHGPCYISSKKLDPLIDAWVASLADFVSPSIDVVERVEDEGRVERLRAEWNAYQARLDKLTRLLVDEVVSEASYRATRSEIEGQQAAIRAELDEAQNRLASASGPPQEVIIELAEDWPDMPADVRFELLRTVLAEAVITPQKKVEFVPTWGRRDSSVVPL